MRPNDERSDRSDEQTNATVRMTVQEAAAALGITVEAVRGRMHRGKYKREKTEDGRVFVLLTPDQLPNDRERSDERFNQRSYVQSPNVSDREHAPIEGLAEELSDELRQQVEFLRAELAARNEELRRREEEHREESRRKDHIIMSLTQRIPELEAPAEPREAPETTTEGAAKGDAPPESQESAQRRSWLYRFFFGP